MDIVARLRDGQVFRAGEVDFGFFAGVVGNIEQALRDVIGTAFKGDFDMVRRVFDNETHLFDSLSGLGPADVNVSIGQTDALGVTGGGEGDLRQFGAFRVDEGEDAAVPARGIRGSHLNGPVARRAKEYVGFDGLQAFGVVGDGIHAVDLIALYAAETGASAAITVEDALASDTFKAFAMSKIGEYADYMKKQTSLFSVDETVRFVPSDRLVCQMLSAFDKKLAVTQAGIYHNDLIKMPGYKTVASWQGLGDLTFDKLSKIHVKVAGGTVEQTGVVCLLVDKWAILHTIKKQRVASQHFDIEDVTQYSYQFVDQYMNNLSMPGIVFYMSDYTPA